MSAGHDQSHTPAHFNQAFANALLLLMAMGALVSASVVVAEALTLWKGWVWLDPVSSLLIAAVVLAGTWSLLRQSLHLLFDGVPETIDPQAVHHCLANLPGQPAWRDPHA